MVLRELLEQLDRLDPEAEVLVVDAEEDLDNEGTFAVQTREIEGRRVVEIGSIAPFV